MGDRRVARTWGVDLLNGCCPATACTPARTVGHLGRRARAAVLGRFCRGCRDRTCETRGFDPTARADVGAAARDPDQGRVAGPPSRTWTRASRRCWTSRRRWRTRWPSRAAWCARRRWTMLVGTAPTLGTPVRVDGTARVADGRRPSPRRGLGGGGAAAGLCAPTRSTSCSRPACCDRPGPPIAFRGERHRAASCCPSTSRSARRRRAWQVEGAVASAAARSGTTSPTYPARSATGRPASRRATTCTASTRTWTCCRGWAWTRTGSP